MMASDGNVVLQQWLYYKQRGTFTMVSAVCYVDFNEFSQSIYMRECDVSTYIIYIYIYICTYMSKDAGNKTALGRY